jgi:hypothetical protein
MKSMKLSKKESKNEMAVSSEGNQEYPWGLRIDLDKKALKKLGKKCDDFKVGSKGKIIAEYTVTSISESEYMGEEGHESVGLQITALELEGKDANKVQAMRKRDSEIGGVV